MILPNISFFENDGTVSGGGTPITSGNPISFLNSFKGVANSATPNPIQIWNDKDGFADSDTAANVSLTVIPGNEDDVLSPIFTGTVVNGFLPMIEAQSTDAFGIAADNQSSWTPIGLLNALSIGNMPQRSMRVVNLRLNVPSDSPDIAMIAMQLQVNFSDLG